MAQRRGTSSLSLGSGSRMPQLWFSPGTNTRGAPQPDTGQRPDPPLTPHFMDLHTENCETPLRDIEDQGKQKGTRIHIPGDVTLLKRQSSSTGLADRTQPLPKSQLLFAETDNLILQLMKIQGISDNQNSPGKKKGGEVIAPSFEVCFRVALAGVLRCCPEDKRTDQCNGTESAEMVSYVPRIVHKRPRTLRGASCSQMALTQRDTHRHGEEVGSSPPILYKSSNNHNKPSTWIKYLIIKVETIHHRGPWGLRHLSLCL